MASRKSGFPLTIPAALTGLAVNAQNSRQQDLSRLDRNLDSLMQELSMKCCRIFNEASKATSRSATVAFGQTPASLEISGVEQRLETPLFVRERTSNDTTKV